ncbi:MAG TPA: hypothetical protein VKQ30_20680 [Ktedonobacterales bacterium]|nr:hypothetical protein [Ktedonobacterales bacterium]
MPKHEEEWASDTSSTVELSIRVVLDNRSMAPDARKALSLMLLRGAADMMLKIKFVEKAKLSFVRKSFRGGEQSVTDEQLWEYLGE